MAVIVISSTASLLRVVFTNSARKFVGRTSASVNLMALSPEQFAAIQHVHATGTAVHAATSRLNEALTLAMESGDPERAYGWQGDYASFVQAFGSDYVAARQALTEAIAEHDAAVAAALQE